MRKRLVAFAGAALLALSASSASAAEGVYVGGFLGFNVLADADIGGGAELTFDPGGALSGAVGVGVTPNVRVEGEIAIRANDIDEVCFRSFCGDAGDSMNSVSLMANAFYDFDTGGNWRPYLGGGVGFAVVTLDPVVGSDDDDTVLAGQFGAGIAVGLSQQAALTFDYRLFVTDDPSFTKLGFSAEYVAHTLGVGVRVHF